MQPSAVLSVDDIRLSDLEFWTRPMEEREGAFATLRAERPISFHEEPYLEGLGLPRGPGFWALTRSADILEVSRSPQTFCSGNGVNVTDMPADFSEFFGSMISMDDPRHARLRRIVSRGFTPRHVQRLEENVQRTATAIVDAVIDRGECDFVADIAAALPLKIICDMMGIPDSQYRSVFERTNIILGAGDPEYVSNPLEILPAILQAGAELAQLVQDLGRHRAAAPDRRPHLRARQRRGRRRASDRAGARLLLRPARRRRQRDDAQRHQPRHEGAVRLPRPARTVGRRLRAPGADGRRGDRPLGHTGHPLPAHGDAGHRTERPEDPRRREGGAVVLLGEP